MQTRIGLLSEIVDHGPASLKLKCPTTTPDHIHLFSQEQRSHYTTTSSSYRLRGYTARARYSSCLVLNVQSMNPVHQVRVYGKCQKSQLLFRRNPKTTRYRLLHLRKRGSSPTCQTNTKCASPLSPAEQNLPLKSKQICIASQRQSRYIKQQRQSFKETSISIRIMIILPWELSTSGWII